jgi:hypothetical protein
MPLQCRVRLRKRSESSRADKTARNELLRAGPGALLCANRGTRVAGGRSCANRLLRLLNSPSTKVPGYFPKGAIISQSLPRDAHVLLAGSKFMAVRH